jgi:hypothetical protein
VNLSYDRPLTIERPRFGLWKPKVRQTKKGPEYYSRTKLPDRVDLVLTPPPLSTEMSSREVRDEIQRRVKIREDSAEAARASEERKVLGMRRVRLQHWNALPQTRDDMFGPTQTIAGRSHWARLEAQQRSKAFREAYRAALEAWHRGDPDVVFPWGTYLMARRFGVRCGPPPT